MHKVKIVSISKPLIEGINTAEEFIAYAARVSNPSNQMNTLTAPKLLKYCVEHKHWSVFEMVNVVMEIETTRDIARQILRHRSFSFQEFSQRYADPTKDLGFITTREARLQDKKNRQNSIETKDEYLQEWWEREQRILTDSVKTIYNRAIENGMAKEQARAILPEGLTISRMYMNGTLRSFIHWIHVRTDPTTQKEHRLIAIDAYKELIKEFSFIDEIFELEAQ